MLCWVLVEQVVHEHMSDEYKSPMYYYRIAEDPILVLQTKRGHHSESTYRTDDCGEIQADKQ